MDFEELDLAALAARLESESVSRLSLSGFVRGRTAVRDAIVEGLACSESAAEALVDILVGRGFLRFEGDPAKAQGGGFWRFHPDAS